MSRATYSREFLRNVYGIIQHVGGVQPITGRNQHNILFVANIETVVRIRAALVQAFGEPTIDHPMLAEIKWLNGKNVIILPKAASEFERGVLKQLSAWSA